MILLFLIGLYFLEVKMNIELSELESMMYLNQNLNFMFKMIITQKKPIPFMRIMSLFLNFKMPNFLMVIFKLMDIPINLHLKKIFHIY